LLIALSDFAHGVFQAEGLTMLEDGRVLVGARGAGWFVETNGIVEPLAFLSGGRAEAYARAVAAIWARNGHHTYLTVEDACGHVIGKRFFTGDHDEAA
jgi:hypothetical protein